MNADQTPIRDPAAPQAVALTIAQTVSALLGEASREALRQCD
jgi:hypothetical protein